MCLQENLVRCDSNLWTLLQDTNLCPDIEIRIQLAPSTILPCSNASYFKYLLQNLSLSMESISFGDGSYRAMVDHRMATGNPLVVPF